MRLKTRCALVQVSEVAREAWLRASPPAAPAPVARHIPAPAPATDSESAVAHGTRNQQPVANDLMSGNDRGDYKSQVNINQVNAKCRFVLLPRCQCFAKPFSFAFLIASYSNYLYNYYFHTLINRIILDFNEMH